ncbi:DUF7319 domain-containing protein [Natronosalvus caseinilyticus]|uniref:DUF7319 domain-containing protein n=1 Tax=Natronosalvus caseinilyticus TaxID=2953747 RepID=UPI0028A8BAC2|nr:hypothetical protein [Natronosalvus caseinilyticus]
MTDASDEPSAGRTTEPSADPAATGDDDQSVEDLRRQVEAKYDFENFSEADMAEISPEEWDVAFDADTWITGDELLERVERELKSRIAYREVFAMLEYAVVDGRRSLVAYSDTDYAIIFPDGTVEGRGTVVRDVKPTVALCSMESYDVEEPPADWHLPEPADLEGEHSELGNWMLQLLAAAQLVIGVVAIGVWLVQGLQSQLVLGIVGFALVVISLVLFLMVANARLSNRFRTEAYESRLRTIGSGDRPSFLPIDDEAFERDAPPRNRSPLEE